MFRKLGQVQSNSKLHSREQLLPSFSSLDRYCKRKPNDPSALHLFGLVSERFGHDELAIDAIRRAITQLEQIYEKSEDSQIERRYAIANTNLGRLLVTSGQYEDAIETLQTAYGLLSEEDQSIESVALRAMCQSGCGIAHFQLGNLEDAVTLFESAQEIASTHIHIRGQMAILMAQALWASGNDELKESAKNQLLEV